MPTVAGRTVRRTAAFCLIAVFAAVALIAVTAFPYDSDVPLSAEELARNREYYAKAYKGGTPAEDRPAAEDQPASEYETKYIRIAKQAADSAHINEQVQEFVATYGLRNGALLDIGSGRGYLQDVAENYTGLDISESVSRFYHKKFVLGSATAMPFPDSSFDGGWSIWVLEHVPNPEQALAEIRRVMKNNAVFFLYPAWNCPPWAANGYPVRPFSDFDWTGMLIKASVPLREFMPFELAQLASTRAIRDAAYRLGEPRLHYRRLVPNYTDYWMPDSDAVNSIDRYEVMLWFRGRGDECLNCSGLAGSVIMGGVPALIIRIHK